jgi:transmembrane sensor
MNPQQVRELLEKYSRGECTEAERKFIDGWYENISSWDEYHLPTDEAGDRTWEQIKPRRKGTASSPPKRFLKFAAVCSLIAAVFFAGYHITRISPSPEVIISFRSGNSEDAGVRHIENTSSVAEILTLEDGSLVKLQPGSSLLIPQHFNSTERTVTLNGEAFFDIRRDTLRPFTVYSGEVITRVLGTSFNVKAFDSEKEIVVSVKTGKVSVSSNSQARIGGAGNVVLTPNQQIVYNKKQEKVSKQLVPEPELILENPTIFRMQYDGAPVAGIFQALEENYGVDIEYDPEILKGCVLTTSMSDEGLFERIAIICRAIDAHYTVDDAVITIKSKGCN